VGRCEKSRDRISSTGTGAVDEREGIVRASQSAGDCITTSALRCQPRADRNGRLREQIVALAQRHRPYGAEMIYLKLRQAGQLVNRKRVERLYTLQKLQVRRRRRKKIPMVK
jgi:hypothetical protein